MAHEVVILDTRPILSADPGRAGKVDRLIFYSVDGGGARHVIVAGDNPTDLQIQEAIKKAEKERGALAGKTFKID